MRSLAKRAVAPFVGVARVVANVKIEGRVWRTAARLLVLLNFVLVIWAVWLAFRPAAKSRQTRAAHPESAVSESASGSTAAGMVMKIVPPPGGPLSGSLDVLARSQSSSLPAMPTIVVDPGHGGIDCGARRNGLLEKDLTLDTALRVEAKLRLLGFSVVLTRREDRYVELSERSRVANRLPRSLFVSIHFNDFASGVGQGVETFFATDKVPEPEPAWYFADLFPKVRITPPADNGLAFARTMQSAAVRMLGISDRGVKAARLAVVRHTLCPAVLIEGGFINNPIQAREIGTQEYRDKLADAIVAGIATYQRQCLEEEKLRVSQAGKIEREGQ